MDLGVVSGWHCQHFEASSDFAGAAATGRANHCSPTIELCDECLTEGGEGSAILMAAVCK